MRQTKPKAIALVEAQKLNLEVEGLDEKKEYIKILKLDKVI